MKKTMCIAFRFKNLIYLFLSSLFSVALVILFSMNNAVISTVKVNTDSAPPIIIIDAGHGGEDGGTQSSAGVLEKDINLSIAKKVNAILLSQGYNTIMIRNDDRLIYGDDCSSQREKKVSDIHNRMKIIEENPNCIFLSIHQNHFSQSKYNGAQVFYSPNNERSSLLAESVQKSIVSLIQQENERKIKKSGTEIYLLYHAKCPSIMVECGFLSNPGEALLLNDDEYQKKMSLAIVHGVIKYIKGV